MAIEEEGRRSIKGDLDLAMFQMGLYFETRGKALITRLLDRLQKALKRLPQLETDERALLVPANVPWSVRSVLYACARVRRRVCASQCFVSVEGLGGGVLKPDGPLQVKEEADGAEEQQIYYEKIQKLAKAPRNQNWERDCMWAV